MIKKYVRGNPHYDPFPLREAHKEEDGEYYRIEDIEKVFNELQFPQLGDDCYIDGFNKAYELLNEAIFGN